MARVYGTSLSLPAAQDGIYFIKAVDTSGNESAAARSIIATIPSILNWNAQAYLVQEPAWAGAKTGMSANGGDLFLDSGTAFDDITDIDALPDWDYGVVAVPAVGYYETGPSDLGSVQNCRCRGELSFYAVDRETGFNNIADIDALDNFNGADILGVGMLLQIALSQDGAVWGDWQNFLVGDYRARAFRFRLKAWSDFATRYVYADSLHIGIDMPERVERGDGVSLAAGGAAISFGTPFMIRPQIGVAVESASSGDTIRLSSQLETGFTLQVLNGGTGVARTVDWRAVGY